MLRKRSVLIGHALLGWAACGATVALGRQVASMEVTLLVHAAVAPLVFGLLARHYFARFPGSSPLGTAFAFLGIAAGLDAGIVAPLVERSFAMFRSLLGTWIPFALIFLASYAAGRLARPPDTRGTAAVGR